MSITKLQIGTKVTLLNGKTKTIKDIELEIMPNSIVGCVVVLSEEGSKDVRMGAYLVKKNIDVMEEIENV